MYFTKTKISNTQENHGRGAYLRAGDEAIEATLDQLLDHEEGHACVEADQRIDNKQEALLLVWLRGEDCKP